MSTGALIMLILSWTFVLGLMAWSFWRILGAKEHFDPDGIGPQRPPEPGRAESKRGKQARR